MDNQTEAPMWMLAELTYRCPLECGYCSNPLEYNDETHTSELDGDQWKTVLEQARSLGVVQLGLSGGEPLLHPDVISITDEADRLGLYTSLITGGTELDERRLNQLENAGLDHVQISFDGAVPGTNNGVTNRASFQDKYEAARRVKNGPLPLTINTVLHRLNLDEVGELIDLAHDMDARRIELANTQYHGWAYANRKILLPTREQLDEAEDVVERRRRKYPDLEIVWVRPDYYEEYPKPCMDGWASNFINVTPGGLALPCQSALSIDSIEFPNVTDRQLSWIWYDSPAFNKFRGYDWMGEPCSSCPRKTIDYGGCRCQAFAVTGDAGNADPVCQYSDYRETIDETIETAQETDPEPGDLFHRNPQSIVDFPPGLTQ